MKSSLTIARAFFLAAVLPCLLLPAETTSPAAAKPQAATAAEALRKALADKDADAVCALTREAVTNSCLPAADRLRNAVTCLEWHRKMADPADQLAPIDAVRAFVGEVGDKLALRDAARLEDEILKNLWAAGDGVRTQAVAVAEALFANTNAPASYRVHAATLLAGERRGAGDADGADRLLQSCYALNGCAAADLEAVARAIVRPLVLADKCDAAVEASKEPLRHDDSQAMQTRVDKLVVEVYGKFYRMADIRDYWLSRGRKVEAARVCEDSLDDKATAERLYREAIEDPDAPHGDRLAAWTHYFGDAELCERYFPAVLCGTAQNTNAVARALERRIWESRGGSAAYVGDYAQVARLFAILERLRAASPRPLSFQLAQYAAFARCGLRDFGGAVEICRKALEEGVAKTPADAFQLSMMAELLAFGGDEAAALKAVRAADARFRGDLDDKTHLSRIDRLGAVALVGGNEPLARGVAAFRESLFVPRAKREYVVRFSERPITGPEGWDALSPVPERQYMDRTYGGNLDFLLETDVGTGDRGEGIGSEKGKEGGAVPTIQVACDAVGIHFRFEAPDEKARDVAAGLVGAGSFEAYIAAGENEPYYCLLMDVGPKARVSVWNTTYSTAGHKRILSDDQTLCKSETAFTDHSTISYIMLSWNAFSTLIPDDGGAWEFENIHWGRADQASWCGVESAHGRSQWGKLVFDLPPAARIAILKGVVFDARRIYLGATKPFGMGPVDRWRDPVVGDPAFYEECLKPLVGRLDSYLPLVKADMPDADVLKVAEEALPRWRDIRHEVARLRTRYLARRLGR